MTRSLIAFTGATRMTDWVHMWASPPLEAKDKFNDFNS